MQVEVGAVVEGTVTGITKFGAFVSLPDGKSGLVHISEIANTYVSDVNEFLKLGDKVKVRVLAVTPDGKINLSIKRLEPKPQRENGPRNDFRSSSSAGPRREGAPSRAPRAPRAPMQPAAPKTADQLFEERLKAFMSESDSKISSIRQYSDHRTKSRKR